MASDAQTLALIVALAFLPPLVLMGWVRRDEVRQREPFRAVFGSFLYGAITGAFLGALLNLVFEVGYPQTGARLGLDAAFFAIVIGAPFGEELAKALGLGGRRRLLREPEDGIVYGIAIGLGFAATENLVYGLAALASGGTELATTTVIARVFSSMLLHAGTTGLLGFGYARVVQRGGVAAEIIPHYLAAVLFHAAYNYLVYSHAGIGFFAAVVLAVTLLVTMRRRIRQLDALPHGTA